MKKDRSTSQILYGFLPEQTVDLDGDVWKVSEWSNPIRIANIDEDALRRELLRIVQPWERTQRDSYLGRMLRRNDSVVVLGVNPKNGVTVEPFPRQWVCRVCKRLHNKPDAKCQCGKQALNSFHFVGFHDECGAIKQVPLPPVCHAHKQIAVVFPGASKGAELRFVCPVCNAELRRGFPSKLPCNCGKPGTITFTVHRAAAVYTPRSVVIVNAPSAEQRQAIAQAGGRARALAWVIDGMQGAVTDAPATEESLRQGLEAQKLPKDVVEDMIARARESGALTSTAALTLPPDVERDAEDQASNIAIASLNSRRTLHQLVNASDASSALGDIYRNKYPKALDEAGIEAVELYDRFPILTGNFGYTRGKYEAGESALVPFRSKEGNPVVYATLTETEALFFKLNPMRVAAWLNARGWDLPAYHDHRSARLAILERCRNPTAMDRDSTISQDLFMLVHSFAHRAIRLGANFAGIDRNALAELLVPLHLGFFVYAGTRGDFILGGLQAVFESQLHEMVRAIVHQEWRCPMDPGCTKGGGACIGCLHVGEPSCRHFNQLLDRRTLFGEHGYFRPDLLGS